ncbi:MAG: DMT family transporter [Epsilonproteobacteria bacterium]|nr:DMT family transporter [Campylobacterota bacterium]
MFLSSLIGALNGAIAKLLSQDISSLEIVFFRNLFGVFFILATLKHTPSTHKGGKPWLLVWRGIFGFSALLLFFYTISSIPLGEAITLNKTSPLFVALLSFWILKEKPTPKSILALIAGFVGIVLITKPFGISFSVAHILGAIGGFLAAAAYTTIGKIKDIYDSRTIVLSFMTTGVIAPLILFAISSFYAPKELSFMLSPFQTPSSLKVWLLLFALGITATLSQYFLTKAYSSSHAFIVATVSYVNIPFAIFFGFLLGDSIPDTLTIIGIFLIVAAGIAVKSGK